MNPLAIDLFCGLGGWAEGFLSEGYDVIGFDIERHDYGTGGYPGALALQDVLTLHGSQFKDAAVIVASPPCQEYSYMAMPWSRAKAIAREYRHGERDVKQLTALFDACFRIQREASEAAGRYIPLIVENVRGAQPWVGRSRWHYGSFHLWGDVPALMPITIRQPVKQKGSMTPGVQRWCRDGIAGIKAGDRCKDESGKWTTEWNVKNSQDYREGLKLPGNNSERLWSDRRVARLRDSQSHPFYNSSSKSDSRKAASAQIAKIPFPLARWIARVYRP